MIIKIYGGSYTSEQRAIGREIARHLHSLGITVEETHPIPENDKHNLIIQAMSGEGFPVQVEVIDDAFDRKRT